MKHNCHKLIAFLRDFSSLKHNSMDFYEIIQFRLLNFADVNMATYKVMIIKKIQKLRARLTHVVN